jgi:hypothetical protein
MACIVSVSTSCHDTPASLQNNSSGRQKTYPHGPVCVSVSILL